MSCAEGSISVFEGLRAGLLGPAAAVVPVGTNRLLALAVHQEPAGTTTMEIPMARPRRNLTTVRNHSLGASPCSPANAA